MAQNLVWITGASAGIGKAMAASVPWSDSRVIGVSRSEVSVGVEHLRFDLSRPGEWPSLADAISDEARAFRGERMVFVHAAATVEPIAFADEADPAEYTAAVLLNAAAPMAIGAAFLRATSTNECERTLVQLTSGAARSVYPGWSTYGPSKAAVDHWVRTVGQEQAIRGGARVIAVGPGTVSTGMQVSLRRASEESFPDREKFVALHEKGALTSPEKAAADLWRVVQSDLPGGSVVDLRDLAAGS